MITFNSPDFVFICYIVTAFFNILSLLVSLCSLAKAAGLFEVVSFPAWSANRGESNGMQDLQHGRSAPKSQNNISGNGKLGRIQNLEQYTNTCNAIISGLLLLRGLDGLVEVLPLSTTIPVRPMVINSLLHKLYIILLQLSLPIFFFFLFVGLFEVVKIYTVLDSRLTFEESFNKIQNMYSIAAKVTAAIFTLSLLISLLFLMVPASISSSDAAETTSFILLDTLLLVVGVYVLACLLYAIFHTHYLISLIQTHPSTPRSKALLILLALICGIHVFLTTPSILIALGVIHVGSLAPTFAYDVYAMAFASAYLTFYMLMRLFYQTKDYALNPDKASEGHGGGGGNGEGDTDELDGDTPTNPAIMLLDLIRNARGTGKEKSRGGGGGRRGLTTTKQARSGIGMETLSPNKPRDVPSLHF